VKCEAEIETASLRKLEGYKTAGVEIGTGETADTDADIQTMQDLQPRTSLDLGIEQLDSPRTTLLVAYLRFSRELEGVHSDICYYSGQRRPHHPHCQSLTVCVVPEVDCLGLALLVSHTEQEAHGHTGEHRLRGKTSSRRRFTQS